MSDENRVIVDHHNMPSLKRVSYFQIYQGTVIEYNTLIPFTYNSQTCDKAPLTVKNLIYCLCIYTVYIHHFVQTLASCYSWSSSCQLFVHVGCRGVKQVCSLRRTKSFRLLFIFRPHSRGSFFIQNACWVCNYPSYTCSVRCIHPWRFQRGGVDPKILIYNMS